MRTLRLMVLGTALLGLAGSALAQQYGPPPPPRQGFGQGGWDVPPQEMREISRQGFRDGIVGAEGDLENHRRPNVNNRDEFRKPHVAEPLRGDYRMGFRRGYDVAISHALGGYGPPQGRPY